MTNIDNIEVINIETTNEGSFAYISFRDLDNMDSITEGYASVRVPFNLRPLQLSSRGNILVSQEAPKKVYLCQS